MRKTIIFLLGVICSSFVFSQGIYNNGATIVTSGAAQIYIDGVGVGSYTSVLAGNITPSAGAVITVNGDWINSAGNTGFNFDAGTVVFPAGTHNLGGTSSTIFYNVTMMPGSGNFLGINTSIGGAVTTTGIHSLTSAFLNLNGRMLTITNPANTAITYTTGYIISETNVTLNPSILRWKTGAFAASYNFPFGTTGSVQIPLTLNKTVAVASDIDIATRPTATSNNAPWASTVTQMYDPTLGQDGSDEAVIDRWWEISANNSVTADITFRYLGAENTLTVPYNTGNVGAQYWSAAWVPDNLTIGSSPAVLAGVGAHTALGLTISTAYTPWVLSSVSAPLPIELINFQSACNGTEMQLFWSTATETNNDFFTIQRSYDGVAFTDIGTVNGSGTTTQQHNYSFTDPIATSGNLYYQLLQTDFNGQHSSSTPILGQGCGATAYFIDAFASGSEIYLNMNIGNQTDYMVSVIDARGRLVMSQNFIAKEGSNHFLLNGKVPATGVYLVKATDSFGKSFSKRLFIMVD